MIDEENKNTDFKLDFQGVGVPRGGSTWTHWWLSEHPEICMCDTKELNFFGDRNYPKGNAWLAGHFKHCSTGKITGEFSPSIMKLGDVGINRLKEHNPNIKIIISLRNPVKRAYALFMKHKLKGAGFVKENETLKEVVERDSKAYTRYIGKSLYAENLQKYMEAFPKDQLLVQFLEDAYTDPSKFGRRLFEFLDVNPDFVPETLHKEVNRTGSEIALFPGLNYYLRKIKVRLKPYWLKRILRIPIWILIRTNIALGSRNKPVLEPDEETRKFLYEIFKEDINKTAQLVGRDLSHWK